MKRSTGKKIFIGMLIFIAVLLVAVILLVYSTFSFGEDKTNINGGEYVDETDENGDIVVEQLNELRSEGTLSDCLKEWATSTKDGSLMRDKKVTTFLLVGVDKGGGNSDVIMLCSVNRKENKICLTSVMRDSYTYINTPNGEVYAKINAAYSYGGIDTLKKTFENDFKIKIDHYVTVNFQSFSKIVDILGGVTLDVKEYEARAVNAEVPGCPYGEDVTLDGAHALMYCRIRKCDSDGDVSRTRRQRQFVTALIEKSKTMNASQATSIAGTLLEYVKTDLSSTEIVSLGTKALTEKWYNYEIVSSCYPDEIDRMDYSGRSWVWIVDYPGVAMKMQLEIFGTTNITLSEDRLSAIDIMKSSIGTGEARP